MTVTTSPEILVLEEQRLRWQTALIRGQEQQLAVELVTHAGGDLAILRYRVQSESAPGSWHAVNVRYRTRGVERLTTTCTCQAGQVGAPCKHASLAVQDAGGLWPFEVGALQPLPLVELEPEPDPIRTYELRTAACVYRITVQPGWVNQLDEDCDRPGWEARVEGRGDEVWGYGDNPATALGFAVIGLARQGLVL